MSDVTYLPQSDPTLSSRWRTWNDRSELGGEQEPHRSQEVVFSGICPSGKDLSLVLDEPVVHVGCGDRRVGPGGRALGDMRGTGHQDRKSVLRLLNGLPYPSQSSTSPSQLSSYGVAQSSGKPGLMSGAPSLQSLPKGVVKAPAGSHKQRAGCLP